MKKFLAFLVLLMILVALSTPVAQAAAINVTVDGVAVEWSDAEPFIDANGRTLVPLRPVADALNLKVDWNGNTRQATFTYQEETGVTGILGSESVTFSIGDYYARYDQALFSDKTLYYSSDRRIFMDTAAVISNDHTYAPVRYLAETLGHNVTWDETTRTVQISTNKSQAIKNMLYYIYFMGK